jgi:hypothetical protein
MTDILADRFVAIADREDDGSWRDVRRRAETRGRRRWVAPAVAVAAVVLAAVAVAANGGWVFKRAPGSEPSFARTFAFQGASWSLVGYADGDGRIACFSVGRTEALLARRQRCSTALMRLPGLSSPLAGRVPITKTGWSSRGGEIWFGDALPSVARVAVTDTRGKTFVAPAVPVPTLPHPTVRFRLWLVALPSSQAVSIAAYDRHGKLLYRGAPHVAALFYVHR